MGGLGLLASCPPPAVDADGPWSGGEEDWGAEENEAGMLWGPAWEVSGKGLEFEALGGPEQVPAGWANF